MQDRQRWHALENFIRLARCGGRRGANAEERAAFLIATQTLAAADQLDHLTVMGLIEFVAIAKMRRDDAKDFLTGKIVSPGELLLEPIQDANKEVCRNACDQS